MYPGLPHPGCRWGTPCRFTRPVRRQLRSANAAAIRLFYQTAWSERCAQGNNIAVCYTSSHGRSQRNPQQSARSTGASRIRRAPPLDASASDDAPAPGDRAAASDAIATYPMRERRRAPDGRHTRSTAGSFATTASNGKVAADPSLERAAREHSSRRRAPKPASAPSWNASGKLNSVTLPGDTSETNQAKSSTWARPSSCAPACASA